MKATKRAASLLVVFVLVASLTAAIPAAHPPPAKAGLIPGLPSPCDLIPDGAARAICKAATDPIGAAGAAIGSIPGVPDPVAVVQNLFGNVVQTVLNQIVKAESDAVLSVLKDVTNFVNHSTTPNLTFDWFLHLYAIVFGMAVPLGLLLFYTRLGVAVKNQDAPEVGNAFLALMAFLVLGGLIPGVVELMVKALDDSVAPGWMATAGASANDTLNNLQVNFSQSLSFSNNPVTPILLPLIFLFFGLIGGIVIELMLLFRDGMVYVVTAAEIVAVAMAVGGRWGWNTFWRTTNALLALCFFKVIMAFILTVGLLLIGSSGASPVLLGSVVLLMVPILSWAAYRNWANHQIRFLPGGISYVQRGYNYLRS